ncbi:MAG: tetratricopeptide repeat protein [bacterium]|nr:tetratricopeptide repeat protein [bacterium]
MAKRFQLGPEIERYTQLLARDPDSLAFVPLADAYRKSGLFEEAFAVLKRGMGRRPEYIPAKIVLGKCYLDLGNYPKAETTFEDILRLDRDNLVALSSMANVRLHQRRYGEAATIYRRILELDPSNDAAAQQLAKLEGKALSQNQGEVIEIDIESTATRTPQTEPLSGEMDTIEEKVPSTIDFENVMRAESLPSSQESGEALPDGELPAGVPVSAEDPRRTGGAADSPSDAGRMTTGVEPADSSRTGEPTEIDLDLIPQAANLDIVDEESRYAAPEKGGAPPDVPEVVKEPPVRRAGNEPEIRVEVPVPPPPDTEELAIVEPETVEVMPEDEVPPEIPPVKDMAPIIPTEESDKPAFKTFSSWLSGMSGRKDEEVGEEDKGEEK